MVSKITMSKEELARRFAYLDDLRESAEVNMFGAGAYVERRFGDSRNDAREVVLAWMEQDLDQSPEARAGKVLGS